MCMYPPVSPVCTPAVAMAAPAPGAVPEIRFNSRSAVEMHRKLSNFYPFGPDQITVEALYQAAKVEFLGAPGLARRIRETRDPAVAKSMGGKKQCSTAMGAELGISAAEAARRNAQRIRDFKSFDVMKGLLRQKFADPEMRAALLATGDAVLHETGRGTKSPWIVSGGDMLGKLLMQVRAEIRGGPPAVMGRPSMDEEGGSEDEDDDDEWGDGAGRKEDGAARMAVEQDKGGGDRDDQKVGDKDSDESESESESGSGSEDEEDKEEEEPAVPMEEDDEKRRDLRVAPERLDREYGRGLVAMVAVAPGAAGPPGAAAPVPRGSKRKGAPVKHKVLEERGKRAKNAHAIKAKQAMLRLLERQLRNAPADRRAEVQGQLDNLRAELAAALEIQRDQAQGRLGARQEIGALEAQTRRPVDEPLYATPVSKLARAFRCADLAAFKKAYSVRGVTASAAGRSESDVEAARRLMRAAGVPSADARHLIQWFAGLLSYTNMAGSAHRVRDEATLTIGETTLLTCLAGGSGAAADRSGASSYFSAQAMSEPSFRVRHLLRGYNDPRRLFTLVCTWLSDAAGSERTRALLGTGAADVSALLRAKHEPEHVAVAFVVHVLRRLAESWDVKGAHFLLVGRTAPSVTDLVHEYVCQAVRNSLVGAARFPGSRPAATALMEKECDRLALLDAASMGRGFLLTPDLSGQRVVRLSGARYRAQDAPCSTIDTRWWSTCAQEILLAIETADGRLPNPLARKYATCRAASRVYPSALALTAGLTDAAIAAGLAPGRVEPVTHWEFHAPSKTFVAHVAEYGDPAGPVVYALATMLGDAPGRPCRSEDGSFKIQTPCPPRFDPFQVFLDVVAALESVPPALFARFRGCSMLQLLFRLENGGAKDAFVEFGAPRAVHGLTFGARDTMNVVASVIQPTATSAWGAELGRPDARAALPAPLLPAWAFGGPDGSEHDPVNALLDMAIEACALEAALAEHAKPRCVDPSEFGALYARLYGDAPLKGAYTGPAIDTGRRGGEALGRHMGHCAQAAMRVHAALAGLRAHRCFIAQSETHARLDAERVRARLRGFTGKVRAVFKHLPRHDAFLRPLEPYVKDRPELDETHYESERLLHAETAAWSETDLFAFSNPVYPDLPVATTDGENVLAAYEYGGLAGLENGALRDLVYGMLNTAHDTL